MGPTKNTVLSGVSWAERKALCAETIRADFWASWLLSRLSFWFPFSLAWSLKDSV